MAEQVEILFLLPESARFLLELIMIRDHLITFDMLPRLITFDMLLPTHLSTSTNNAYHSLDYMEQINMYLYYHYI